VLASGALRARGGEPRGAAERPTVSGRAAGPARGENRGGREEKKELTRGVGLAERERERGESGVRWEKKGRRQAGPSWQRERGEGGERTGPAEGGVGRGTAHAGEERKEGRELGLGRLWAVGRKRGREARGEREKGRGAGLGCLLSFPFSFSILH
jgi:hypothetical protein